MLQKCVDAVHWSDTAAYLDHFADIPLGPNIGVFVPHTMLLGGGDGPARQYQSRATESSWRGWRPCWLRPDQGYLGMSTDGLPFHYLANAPHTDKRIPTQYASFWRDETPVEGGA